MEEARERTQTVENNFFRFNKTLSLKRLGKYILRQIHPSRKLISISPERLRLTRSWRKWLWSMLHLPMTPRQAGRSVCDHSHWTFSTTLGSHPVFPNILPWRIRVFQVAYKRSTPQGLDCVYRRLSGSRQFKIQQWLCRGVSDSSNEVRTNLRTSLLSQWCCLPYIEHLWASRLIKNIARTFTIF